MENKVSYQPVILLWLAWALLLLGFQALIQMRFEPRRPDRVLAWTPSETGPTSQNDQPYLIEPFMNRHVSWDSEFYLSIAAVGYDDPQVRSIETPEGAKLSLSYAFFPLYPLAIRGVAFPLRGLGLTPIAAATFAGVLVSLLGTLGAMVALYDLTRDALGHDGALRTAFYLGIFPSSFFLAQVYTEGLFVGLVFGCLALLRHNRWGWAALLAACATWTRGIGVALLIPLAWHWYRIGGWDRLRQKLSPKTLAPLLAVASPLLAYLIWSALLGEPFHTVERQFFSRGLFLLGPSLKAWSGAFKSLFGENPQTTAYYLIEFGALLLSLTACALTWREHPDLSFFGLAVILVSLTSGPAQGMHRYVLAVPSLFMVLARWGKRPLFDRAWTLASVLLMGLLATLFTFDFWVG